jgi:hypothetical protein
MCMGPWIEVPPEARMYVVIVLLAETLGWADLLFRNPTENLDWFTVWIGRDQNVWSIGEVRFEDKDGCSPRLCVISALAVTFCTNGCWKIILRLWERFFVSVSVLLSTKRKWLLLGDGMFRVQNLNHVWSLQVLLIFKFSVLCLVWLLCVVITDALLGSSACDFYRMPCSYLQFI